MIPEEFKHYKQWVSWKPVEKEGKIAKIPTTRDNRNASTTNPDTWDTWENIKNCERQGFVFTKNDPFIFIDLDNCIDENGNLETWAEKIVKLIDSYTEYSPSMKGLHIFCIGQLKKPGNRYKNIEIYDSKRYSTMTGKVFPGCRETIEERQKQIDLLHRKYFPKEYEEPRQVEQTSSDLEDDQILEIARNAQNADKFISLWNRDTSGYNSQSEADMALCSLLSFYTQDEHQLDRLFRQSGLYRQKWDREDYRKGIFEKVLRGRTETYTPSLSKVRDYKEEISSESMSGSYPKSYSLDYMMVQDYPPPRFLIQDLLPYGLVVPVGKPKTGKSAWARQVGYAISEGGKAFGDFHAEKGDVLYINFEETKGEVVYKMNKILNGVDPPPGYNFCCKEDCYDGGAWGSIGYGFEQRIREYLKDHPNTRLIIIDTLAYVMPTQGQRKNHDGGYLDTVRVISILKSLCEYVDTILALFHTKKEKVEDFVDGVLGSTGIAATADAIISIHRDRGSIDSQISITGKNVKEQTFQARFLNETWEMLGHQHYWGHLTEERKEIYEIFNSVENSDLSPKQIADRLDKERSNINNIMLTMTGKGQLEKVQTGRYRIPEDIYRRWKEDHQPVSMDDFLEKLS